MAEDLAEGGEADPTTGISNQVYSLAKCAFTGLNLILRSLRRMDLGLLRAHILRKCRRMTLNSCEREPPVQISREPHCSRNQQGTHKCNIWVACGTKKAKQSQRRPSTSRRSTSESRWLSCLNGRT